MFGGVALGYSQKEKKAQTKQPHEISHLFPLTYHLWQIRVGILACFEECTHFAVVESLPEKGGIRPPVFRLEAFNPFNDALFKKIGDNDKADGRIETNDRQGLKVILIRDTPLIDSVRDP